MSISKGGEMDGLGSVRMPLMDEELLITTYKVKTCTRQEPHDWASCPLAHSGERNIRRHPFKHTYKPVLCPRVKGTACASCHLGDACPFSHNVYEAGLHPDRFRTKLCTFGADCSRPVCFFAHYPAQLRPRGSASGAGARNRASVVSTGQHRPDGVKQDVLPGSSGGSASPHAAYVVNTTQQLQFAGGAVQAQDSGITNLDLSHNVEPVFMLQGQQSTYIPQQQQGAAQQLQMPLMQLAPGQRVDLPLSVATSAGLAVNGVFGSVQSAHDIFPQVSLAATAQTGIWGDQAQSLLAQLPTYNTGNPGQQYMLVCSQYSGQPGERMSYTLVPAQSKV